MSDLRDLLGDDYDDLQLKAVVDRANKGDFMPPLHTWLKKINPDFNWDWRHTKYIIDHLQKLSDGEIRKLMISCPPRHGKLLHEKTPILTPSGWKTHGELLPGDYVYHPSGRPIRVLAISEPEATEYIVTLSTGETLETHGNHEWYIYSVDTTEYSILETKEMLDNGVFDNTKLNYYADNASWKRRFDKIKVKKNRKRIAITDISPVETPSLGNCIQVDSPDGLYLVGRTLITTHNSELASIHFPAYFLEKNPQNRVIVGTYNQTLANKLSRKIRSLCNVRIPLNQDKKAMEEWETSAGGGVRAVGVGAGIAGVGANLIILDDVVRSRKDANSITVRNTTFDWYTDDIYTRFEPDSKICVIACLRGTSKVLMSDGTWKEIQSISPGEKVVSVNPDTMEHEAKTVLHQAETGWDKTYSIKTSVSTLVANERHPFLTPDGYKRLKDLRKGDTVFVSLKYILENNNGSGIKTDPEFAWFLGVMFGDGWVTSWDRNNYDRIRNKHYKSKSRCICFARGVDEILNERVLQYFEKFFGKRPVYNDKERYYRLDSNSSGRFMEDIGLSSEYSAKTKRIPQWIFSASNEVKRGFIRGFMEADGCISSKVNERYSSKLANENLLNDLRLLGLTCGVRPTNVNEQVRLVQPPHSPEPILATSYTASFNFEEDYADQLRPVVIREISYTGIKEPVYDLEVEDNHNFIAEGFVVSNTRWHEDDLLGRILNNDKEYGEWVVINLPALAEDDDPLGRSPGEALCPARFNREALLDIKRVMGRTFSALYQGRPTEQEGEIFKASWFREHTIKTLPTDKEYRWELVRYWDKASSTSGDYTVGALMAKERKTKTYYILDIVRGQWQSHERDKIMLETAAKDAAIYSELGTVKIRHEQEPGSSGKDAAKYTNKLLAGFPVKAIKSTGNKTVRAEPYANQCEAGNVYMMKADWNEDFIDEHAVFDRGKNDDIVDAASGAFNELSRGSAFISWGS